MEDTKQVTFAPTSPSGMMCENVDADKTASYSESYAEYLKFKKKKLDHKNYMRSYMSSESRKGKNRDRMFKRYHSEQEKKKRATPEFKAYRKAVERRYRDRQRAKFNALEEQFGQLEVVKIPQSENNNNGI
jgi:multidrug efflux pump subunit AcrB